MANALVKETLKGTMKKKSALSKVAPRGVRQTESMSGMRSMEPNSIDLEMKAREDARTLHEAHKIRNDKQRLSAVKDHVMSMSEALGGPVTTSGKKK